MAQAIDVQTLKKMVAEGAVLTLLDVRRKRDYEAAPETINGAHWHDPEMLDSWAGEFPADRPVVVYCVKGGSVSRSVADRLMDRQLDVCYLEGGILAWQAAKPGG